MVELCNQLGPLLHTHINGYRFWIQRKQALSLYHLGRNDEALEIYDKLLLQKHDWFLFSEWGEILMKNGSKELAISAFAKALLMPGEMRFKCFTLKLISNCLDQELSELHERLIQLIYKEQGWGIKNDLNYLKSSETIPILIKKLKPIWSKFEDYVNYPGIEIGKIDKILHHNDDGIDGFIKSESNECKIYFQNSRKSSQFLKGINLGARVTYKLKEGNGNRLKASIEKIISCN